MKEIEIIQVKEKNREKKQRKILEKLKITKREIKKLELREIEKHRGKYKKANTHTQENKDERENKGTKRKQ